MIVIVSGARTLKDRTPIERVLERIEGQVAFYHGGAEGADTLAKEYALLRGWTVYDWPANWDLYGKAAGPIRNAEMLLDAIKLSKTTGRDLHLYAFPVTRNGGTRNCIAIARTLKVPTTVIEVLP